MKLTIYGPGMQGKHGFHVHKQGCAHGKQRQYAGMQRVGLEVEARMDVVEWFYSDHAVESGDDIADPNTQYARDFHFAPRVTIE